MIVMKIYSILFVGAFVIASIASLKRAKTDIEKRTNISSIIFLLPILIYIIWS